MTSITIRNVPAETRDELAARAARSGRSLQEYLRGELIRMAEKPGNAEVMRRVAEDKARYGTSVSADAIVATIREDRDSH